MTAVVRGHSGRSHGRGLRPGSAGAAARALDWCGGRMGEGVGKSAILMTLEKTVT
jgi:hypothetical protein